MHTRRAHIGTVGDGYLALLIGRDVVKLARGGDDGTWRYDICALLPDQEEDRAPDTDQQETGTGL